MKKLVFILLLFIPSLLFAQYYDIGFSGGTSYYIGDLNRLHFNPQQLSYSAGFHYRINFNDYYSTRSSINYSTIAADDKHSSSSFNQERNLRFESTILEASQTIEFNFLPFEIGSRDKYFTPYIFGGIAIFKFTPKSKYINGEEFGLQFLNTEQLNEKYDLTELAIPFGIGFKTNINRAISFSMEYTARKTFTDYIDDVSGNYPDITIMSSEAAYFADRTLSNNVKSGIQRGDSNKFDWYNSLTATLYFSFGKQARYSCFSHKNQ